MATVQLRGKSWRVIFNYARQQHAVSIGPVEKFEANLFKAKVEERLLRLRQRLLELPPGEPITSFVIRNDISSPYRPATLATTLSQLFKAYTDARSNGSIEQNTLKTVKINLAQIERNLGKNFLLSALTMNDLQQFINRRAKDPVSAVIAKRKRLKPAEAKKIKLRTISPVTIRKELTTFKAAFTWGARAGFTQGVFPSAGLSYPKIEERLPYMRWDEIMRRIAAGGDPAQLWESLYLDADQIKEMLEYLKAKRCQPWVYPMVATAAYTGARRAELLRLTAEDVNLDERVITIREQKRAKGKRTSRRVPINDALAAALTPLMDGSRVYLFGDGLKPLSVNHAKLTFRRMFRKTKWAVVRGFHVLRHSIVSILAARGTDQRVIDDITGHTTDQQRRRYRHLGPPVTKNAIDQAFS